MNNCTNYGTTQGFQDYLEQNKHLSKSEISNEYFHVNVVADAYNKGFEDGEQNAKQNFIDDIISKHNEQFVQNSVFIYILSKRIIDYFISQNCKPCSLFINLSARIPSVIISIPDEYLLDDDFVDLAYSKVFEIRQVYDNVYKKMLDIGLIGSSNLNIDLLKADRYDYQENYCG